MDKHIDFCPLTFSLAKIMKSQKSMSEKIHNFSITELQNLKKSSWLIAYSSQLFITFAENE